ncbi:probable WRKY transcription factor 75 [Phalaenopsis equestris]|uniref:probable WRKY transcription factor 75 n=1 Tax=Phalaenopsis equestris TaxID=78828 RepID=UPI0009E5FA8F|nr:probable WRKY transcription factor 75 [Phalaenopsis equestris]
MAALLQPNEKSSYFSSLHFAELLSPPAIAGGEPSDFDACQYFDGALEAPMLRMMESGDLYECQMEYEEVKRRKAEAGCRIGFRTKSEVEVLDDGFKWRKYGKKAVKNSPNPRNYYRCSSTGCEVKKRVERDRSDSNYVITIYEGTHNHMSPDCRPYTTDFPQPAISSHSFLKPTP